MKSSFRAVLVVLFLPVGALAQSVLVDFDNPQPPGSSGAWLQGEYGGIDWGSSTWRWTGPFGADNTNSTYFGSGSGNSRTFTFANGPQILEGIDVYALTNGILTLSDDQGQSIQQSVTSGNMQTVATSWTTPSSSVTVAYTAGWDLGVDNLRYNSQPPPPPPQYSLSVSRLGDGAGTVTSQPAGIDCGVDCTEVWDQGTTIVLSANPAAGSSFDGWGGDADCSGGSVTLAADTACLATFSLLPPPPPPPPQFTVSVTVSGAGTISSSPAGIDCGTDCSEAWDEDTGVTLTATPDAGSIFIAWSGDADCSDGQLAVTQDLTCNSEFQPAPPPPQFTLAVGWTGTGSGVITSLPTGIDCGSDCSQAYDLDTEVALSASADPGSMFTMWTGNPDCGDGVVTMSADLSCTAEFVAINNEAGQALRFYGNGSAARDRDRLKFLVDDYTTDSDEGFPLDVGASDFTIEFWMRAVASENQSNAVNCGANDNWIQGNIVVDRDRFNRPKKFGLSIAGGRLAFGVTGTNSQALTICGNTNVLDDAWHHVAMQRGALDGQMSIYVDGVLDAIGQGPTGDISYPGNAVPGNFCGPGGNQPCTDSDPYLVIGAEKHDAGADFPAYSGYIDELRISNIVRYTSNFSRPDTIFIVDVATLGLYHFDEGSGEVVRHDAHPVVGARDGVIRFGGTGSAIGPVWVTSDAPLASP